MLEKKQLVFDHTELNAKILFQFVQIPYMPVVK